MKKNKPSQPTVVSILLDILAQIVTRKQNGVDQNNK